MTPCNQGRMHAELPCISQEACKCVAETCQISGGLNIWICLWQASAMRAMKAQDTTGENMDGQSGRKYTVLLFFIIFVWLETKQCTNLWGTSVFVRKYPVLSCILRQWLHHFWCMFLSELVWDSSWLTMWYVTQTLHEAVHCISAEPQSETPLNRPMSLSVNKQSNIAACTRH